jgi:hypothetical protein
VDKAVDKCGKDRRADYPLGTPSPLIIT